MKVLIIEDEKPASQKLIRLLKEIDAEVEIVDVLTSVEKTLNWIPENPNPDLIFMDIQLEDGLCFEIFENYDLKIPVIFTTAYDKYTLKAFKVNSVDYLLKPIVADELKTALAKFNTLHYHKTDHDRFESLIRQLQPVIKERFLIKIGDHYRSVPTQHIHCFYINARCNFMRVENGQDYALDYSLDRVEQMVDPKCFFRINRTCIVNFSAIHDVLAYSSNRLKVTLKNWHDSDNLLVSRERVAEFKSWMDR